MILKPKTMEISDKFKSTKKTIEVSKDDIVRLNRKIIEEIKTNEQQHLSQSAIDATKRTNKRSTEPVQEENVIATL